MGNKPSGSGSGSSTRDPVSDAGQRQRILNSLIGDESSVESICDPKSKPKRKFFSDRKMTSDRKVKKLIEQSGSAEAVSLPYIEILLIEQILEHVHNCKFEDAERMARVLEKTSTYAWKGKNIKEAKESLTHSSTSSIPVIKVSTEEALRGVYTTTTTEHEHSCDLSDSTSDESMDEDEREMNTLRRTLLSGKTTSTCSDTGRRITALKKAKSDTRGQYVPPKLFVSVDSMAQRKILDLKRWYCMCRPQYKTSCGVAALVSCFNYLFSTLGNGSLPAISQEEALAVLGFKPPFSEIMFGNFTSNATMTKWFEELMEHFHVQGRCYYIYKPNSKHEKGTLIAEDALGAIQKGLQDINTTFLYHCENHFLCPIGYEEVPVCPTQAYYGKPHGDTDTWLLIGDSSDKHPSIHCKRWEDIVSDLNCKNPIYLDIRRLDKGLQKRRHATKKSGNMHCIIAFQRSLFPGQRRSSMPIVSPSLFQPVKGSHDLHALIAEQEQDRTAKRRHSMAVAPPRSVDASFGPNKLSLLMSLAATEYAEQNDETSEGSENETSPILIS